jgi:hypothetical protein
LVAYLLIGRGTRSLIEHAKFRLSSNESRLIVLAFLILGVAYCFFTFQKLNLHSLTATDNPYYLPGWLLITTIIIPYLYAWFSGLLAAYEMLVYGRNVTGVFYRRGMQLLAAGLVGIIASSVIIQYIRTVVPRAGHLSLNTTLLMINIIYICMAIGFVLIIIGANRLKKIEEV